jgi:hypothetical protein
MIKNVEDYEYVVGDNIDDEHPHGDMDRILINGEIMPLRTGVSTTTGVERKRILRGEDVCFLLEWLLQRYKRDYGYWVSRKKWNDVPWVESNAIFTRQLTRICLGTGKKNNVWLKLAWMGWNYWNGSLWDGWPHLCFFKADDLKSISGDIPGTKDESNGDRASYFIREHITHVDLWPKDFQPYQGGHGRVTDNGVCLTLDEVEYYFKRFAEADRLGYGGSAIATYPPLTLTRLDGSTTTSNLGDMGRSKEFVRTSKAEQYTRFVQFATPGNKCVEFKQTHAEKVVILVAHFVTVREKQLGESEVTKLEKIVVKPFEATKGSDGAFSIQTDIFNATYVSRIISDLGIDVDGWTAAGSATTGVAYITAEMGILCFPIVWYDDHTSLS